MSRPGVRPAAVAAVLAPLLLLAACSSEEAAPSAAGSSSSTSAAPSSSAPVATAAPSATTAPDGTSAETSAGASETAGTAPAPAGEAPVGVTTLAPVAAGEPAPFGDGLVARITARDDVQIVGDGPGEVSGPGVAVTVALENGTASDVDLSSLVVNASVDGAPAPASSADPSDPATGVLVPGASGAGTWVFAVPAGSGAALRVEVTSTSSTSVVVLDS